jgi:hypothetical protein
MNFRQKIIVGLGTLLILITGLYPPYEGVYIREGDNLKIFLGYHRFFDPPTPHQVAARFPEYNSRRRIGEIPKELKCRAYIDIKRAAFQIVIIILTTAGIVIILEQKRKKN